MGSATAHPCGKGVPEAVPELGGAAGYAKVSCLYLNKEEKAKPHLVRY